MNYRQIMLDLKEAGWNHYRINKRYGISYQTLRRLRDNDNVDARLTTHNQIVSLHNQVKGETND